MPLSHKSHRCRFLGGWLLAVVPSVKQGQANLDAGLGSRDSEHVHLAVEIKRGPEVSCSIFIWAEEAACLPTSLPAAAQGLPSVRRWRQTPPSSPAPLFSRNGDAAVFAGSLGSQH